MLTDIYKNDTVVIFTADWCKHCPSVKNMCNEYSPVPVVEIDVEYDELLAEREDVRGLPTVKLMKGGYIIDELRGAQDRRKIQNAIQSAYGRVKNG